MSIQFINQSSIVSAADLTAAIAAWNHQLDNEFAVAWGKPHYVATFTILDEPGPNDPSGALGYHDRDSKNIPYARIFAKLAMDNGVPWTGVGSHELLEMSVNPDVDRFVVLDTSGGAYTSGWIVPEEICDAVEDQFYTAPNGVQLSNFVLRNWYIPGATRPFDYMGKLTASLMLAHGGYVEAGAFQSQGFQDFSGYLSRRSQRKVHFLR